MFIRCFSLNALSSPNANGGGWENKPNLDLVAIFYDSAIIVALS